MTDTPAVRRSYRRLSGQDAAFLSFEGEGRPMHIGAVAFISSDGWRDASGAFDFPRLAAMLLERAKAVPGMDQRLGRAPLSGWPIWIREGSIDWTKQVELCDPVATEDDVRSIAEAAMALHMDRSRPLWKLIVVPGLEGGSKFAVIFLAHHSLVDGIAGIDLITLLLDPREGAGAPPPLNFIPLRSDGQLKAAELARWIELPALLTLKAAQLATNGRRFRRVVRRGAALVRTSLRLLTPGPKTGLRSQNEGERTVAWFSIEERPLRNARKRLHGSPNDLVLAAVAQALSEMGSHHRFLPLKLRAAVPVSFRTRAQRYALGNRIGLLLTPLELRDRDPGRTVARIRRHTAIQKHRGDAEGYEVLTEMTAWTGIWSQKLLHWLASKLHSYGILVTSVPGPARAYTLGGAELSEIYPLVPLFGSQSVSVAAVRYRGAFRIGVTSSWADRTMVDEFAARLQAAFATLTRATAAVGPVGAPKAAGEALPGSFAAG
ncbi:MAG: wax ester/triacylglycerol synthase domain-containing protein [Anaerolineaceae bacterium]